MSLEVIYHDLPVDTGAVEVSGNGQSFSTYDLQEERRELPPLATLEPDSWALDGQFALLGEAQPPEFWGSALSDENGELSQSAMVRLTLEKPCDATGITLVFSEETDQWCSRICLRWYGQGILLGSHTAFPTSPRFVLERPVTGFDAVELYLEKTSRPYRFPRLSSLQLGRQLRFGSGELSQVRLLSETDPTLCTLSADTMTVSVRQEHYTLLPQENQRMELYRDGQLVTVQYITQCRREAGNRYVFSCQSLIGLLEEPFLGCYLDTTARGAVEEIFGADNAVQLHETLRDCPVKGCLEKGTRREALQQLAFAMGARVTTAGGELALTPLETAVTGSFSRDKVFAGIRVDSDQKLARVELTAHAYAPGEEQTLVKDLALEGGEALLTFDTLYRQFSAEGGQILEQGSSYVRIAGDTVTVRGIPWLRTGKLYSRSTGKGGAMLSVDRATLINDSNAETVLERLFQGAQLRQRVTLDAVLEGQYAGQRVSVPTPWGETLEGTITAIDARLTPHSQTATVTVQAR